MNETLANLTTQSLNTAGTGAAITAGTLKSWTTNFFISLAQLNDTQNIFSLLLGILFIYTAWNFGNIISKFSVYVRALFLIAGEFLILSALMSSGLISG